MNVYSPCAQEVSQRDYDFSLIESIADQRMISMNVDEQIFYFSEKDDHAHKTCHRHKVRQLLELELCSWLSEVNGAVVNLVLTCRR